MDDIDAILAKAAAPAPSGAGGDDIDRILAKAGAPAPRAQTFTRSDGRVVPNADLDKLVAELRAQAGPPPAPSILERVEAGAKGLGHLAAGAARAGAQLSGLPTLDDAEKFVASSSAERSKQFGAGLPNLIPGVAWGRAMLDPVKRHQLERGLSDSVTLGYGTKIADKVGGAVDPEHTFAATQEADAAAQPDYRALGQLGGSFLPGATSAIAGAGGRAAAALAPAARSALGAAAQGAVKGVAGYEASAPLTAALSADAAGNRLEAARQAATDPIGLITSGALGGASEGGRTAVANSRGGQARRFIEEAGGGAKVGVTSPGAGGVFDRELAGVPATDRGIGQAAERGAEQLVEQIKEQHRIETSAPYKKMQAAIDASPAARAPRDVTPLVTQMQAAIDDLDTSSHARGVLKEQLELLEKHRDPANGAVVLPERQLNGLRRSLMRVAKIGDRAVPGEAEAPLRAAAFAAKQMVDDGPYRLLNAFYAQGAEETAARRVGLGMKAKPAKDQQVDVNKARLTLERGEPASNSRTAGAYADRLNAFRAANPAMVPATDLPSLARARADLAFRLAPQHGGLMERAGGPMGKLELLHQALTHPVRSAIGAATLNTAPIAGRLLYPFAQAAPAASDIGQRIARSIYAARAGQQPDE